MVFFRNNTKRYIDTYIEYHKKNIEYKKSEKTWHVISGKDEGVENSDREIIQMPF